MKEEKRSKPYKQTKMFSKNKDIVCYNCNQKGHLSTECPEPKKDKGQKKEPYKNKKGKVNYFNLPSDYEESVSSSSTSDSDEELNRLDDSSDDSGDELCLDPHCTECYDECQCSDPDVCRCNSINMMHGDTDETSRSLFTQMISANDPQMKEMYKDLLMKHLQKPLAKKENPSKGYDLQPHYSLLKP